MKGMATSTTRLCLGTLAFAVTQAALAGTDPYFNPLTQSTAVASVGNHLNELNSPWQAPAGLSQSNLMSMQEVEDDVAQTIQRVDAGGSSSMFDMIAYDPSGRYLFIPHETPFGAGLSRYDTKTDTNKLLFAGDQGGQQCPSDPLGDNRPPTAPCDDWSYDFGAFDPARFTPNGTVIMAEEWTALGRVVEVLDPLGSGPASYEDAIASPNNEGHSWRVLESIAKVSHEGIAFSEQEENEVIYFIDEWNSGSIYKLVLNKKGDYAGGGQTFVLAVDAFNGDPAALWNEGVNATATRFGHASWKPITDAGGNMLPGREWDPFMDGVTDDPRTQPLTRGGRGAADEAGGTPYGRPEDMEIGVLPNGNEILYVTTTSEHAVISIEILNDDSAFVRQFASRNTPKNVGFASTTGTLDSPDNLASDALGNIYIIEDQPNGGNVGGDIWFARDADNDGVAESLDHFLSNQVNGSESTGMIFHPKDPTRFVIAVQHPASTNLDSVPAGFGDAVWEFDVEDVVPPTCDNVRRGWSIYSWRSREWVTTCSSDYDFNFVQQLEKAGRPQPPRRHRWWR